MRPIEDLYRGGLMINMVRRDRSEEGDRGERNGDQPSVVS
jgi:hypothetical protein